MLRGSQIRGSKGRSRSAEAEWLPLRRSGSEGVRACAGSGKIGREPETEWFSYQGELCAVGQPHQVAAFAMDQITRAVAPQHGHTVPGPIEPDGLGATHIRRGSTHLDPGPTSATRRHDALDPRVGFELAHGL